MSQLKTLISLALLAFTAAACQNNSYKIVGTAEGLSDGDTLVLRDNNSDSDNYIQKFVVKEGAFEVEGEAGPGPFCTIYAAKKPHINVSFFLEPGRIDIKMTSKEATNHVGGTKANDVWQELNSKIAQYNEQMQQLAQRLYDMQQHTQEEQQDIVAKLQQMEEQMVKMVIDAAEKNYDNEAGYFIVTQFSTDEEFTPAKRLALIKKMPAKFRNRAELKELEAELKQAQTSYEGSQILDFSLPTPEGKSLSAMSVARNSKLTILDFWASWCGPCRQEMPNMVRLYEAYQSKGLAILGISLDESHDSWTKAIKEMNMSWPQVSDLKGWNSAAAAQFQVKAIPQVFIIDQEGTIVARGLRGAELERYIAEHLD